MSSAATRVSPPGITTQPAAVTVSAGKTATFVVLATGNPTPTFQWMKNGTDISGATATTYTTPALSAAEACEMLGALAALRKYAELSPGESNPHDSLADVLLMASGLMLLTWTRRRRMR